MSICREYLHGQCKFGNVYANEQPSGPEDLRGGPVFVRFTQDGLTKDMTPGAEKPLWPLSSYGPAKFEPTIIAHLDESPEELRWKALQALKAGTVTNHQEYETEKFQEADQTYSKVLSEVAQVYDHAVKLTAFVQMGIPQLTDAVYNSPWNTASAAFGGTDPSDFW